MKRVICRQSPNQNRGGAASAFDDPALQVISNYVAELRLLKDLPFSYLVPDEKLLPPESIRFFRLDENWLNALTDGALSIGRLSPGEAENDDRYLGAIVREATTRLARPRFEKMHENHRRSSRASRIVSEARTGLIMRSELVGKWHGLEVFGYCGDRQLQILRAEALSSEILICIFDGELTKFVISEPKTALRFGAPDNNGKIELRDISDGENLGKPLGASLNLAAFAEPNGRLKVSELAAKMGEALGQRVSSPQLAFQLIAVARQAQFIKGG